MSHIKHAQPDHPIQDTVLRRWSPYAFDGRPVPDSDLQSVLEAARWAASAFNEQPWRFVLARRQDETQFARALSCLVEANQTWAQHAGALLLSVVATQFERNGNDNRCAEHDLGLAVGSLLTEATARGLHVHQMAGIDMDRIVETYAVPTGFRPVTAIALGYAKPLDQAGDFAERDGAPRPRRPLSEFVFGEEFGSGFAW